MEFQSIFPNHLSQPMMNIFETQILAQEFYQEVENRENFRAYCQWYRKTAQQHQEELAKMKKDVNIFSWFLGNS